MAEHEMRPFEQFFHVSFRSEVNFQSRGPNQQRGRSDPGQKAEGAFLRDQLSSPYRTEGML